MFARILRNYSTYSIKLKCRNSESNKKFLLVTAAGKQEGNRVYLDFVTHSRDSRSVQSVVNTFCYKLLEENNLLQYYPIMRDRFGCAFPIVQEERKALNNVQTINSNGMYVSSNGYYGYQALPQNQESGNENTEYMDVQISDSGIQFNNYIAPEDRLSGLQQANSNVMRGLGNRKRRCCDDAPLSDFKKRREDKPIPELPSTNRYYINSRQPTHNVPDMPRHLMGHFI